MFMPASMSEQICSKDQQAGPIVHTTLDFRSLRSLDETILSRVNPAPLRAKDAMCKWIEEDMNSVRGLNNGLINCAGERPNYISREGEGEAGREAIHRREVLVSGVQGSGGWLSALSLSLH